VRLRVSVAIALPDRQEVVDLEIEAGALVRDAIAASGLAERFPEAGIAAMRTGIWSRACAPDTPLRDGDRVELYRPLQVDAKAMRRARARARLRTSSTRSRSAR
jgi:putative ubiquitin-RnfH superfamily antitoxin RatB of RatAB toxin-antitoxin module